MRDFGNKIFWIGFRTSKFLEKIRIPCNTIEGALGFPRLGASPYLALGFQFHIQNLDCLLYSISCSFYNRLR